MPNQLEQLPKLSDSTFERGYISSAPKEAASNYMAKGSENALVSGSGKIQNFKGVTQREGVSGGGVMMNVAETYASLGSSGQTAYGNVFNVFSALFYIGAGFLRLAGISLLVNASSTLSLLIKRNGVYTDTLSGPFQAGMAQPSAPIIRSIAPTAGLEGKNNGVVSVVIWRRRSTTGARSVRSLVSNITAPLNQSIAVTFPLIDANGQDLWGIGVTKNAEGRTGAHFELKEILESEVAASSIDGQARTIAIEWRDGDLVGKPFAPTRDFPPPAALFGSTLEDVAYVDGAYADAVQSVSGTVKGAAIAPSERGRPESFSPDTVIFTSDQPTALLKGDGCDWRFGRNSLRVIRYLGGGIKNLSAELVWTGIGIMHQHNAVIGEGGRVYAWTDGRGLVRLGADGLPDSSFANDVAEELKLCVDASKRVLGWDGNYQAVCACYEQTIYPFFTSLGVWGAPLKLAGLIQGNIKSCVTENNLLLITADDGATQRLYEFNIGTGTIAKIVTPWFPARGMLDTVHSVVASVRADNTDHSVTIEVFADGNDAAAESSQSVAPARTGYQRLLPVHPNVIDCDSHAVRITIRSTTALGDCGLESVQTYGESNSIMR